MGTRTALYEAAKHARVKCPTCDRYLRNTRTPFSDKMAKALKELYRRACGGGWYVFPSATDDPGYRRLLSWNLTKLPCWGLVESAKVNPRKNKKKWRVTELGLSFLRGEVGIGRHVFIPTGTMNTARGRPFGPKIYMVR